MSAFVPSLSLSASPVLSRSSICGARVSSSVAQSRATVTMVEKSGAMPFLPKPAGISESMVGYAGFDPLGFSSNMDIKWLQQAEIKHGRVCMLAFAGMLVQEFVHLPDAAYSNPLATGALSDVPSAALWQIFLFCGIVEMITHKGRVSYLDMFEEDAVPGDLGFNPMNMKISDDIKLKEIKNGRLAMCGVGGVIHSMLIYKMPIIAQLLDFTPMTMPM